MSRQKTTTPPPVTRHEASGRMPLTQETLGHLPACVATVVRDYATGDPEQRWELRACSFDLDALDNLPCAKGSLIEIWVPNASYWLRRVRNGGISFCPVAPGTQEGLNDSDRYAWVVERRARDARIIVWKISVVRSETKR